MRLSPARFVVLDARILFDPAADFVGFRYLIRSCPGITLTEEELHALFGRHSGTTAGLTFDGFRTVLADISRTMYLDASAADATSAAAMEAAFLKLAANNVVPQVLQHPSVAAALGKGAVSGATSGGPYPVLVTVPSSAAPVHHSHSPPRDPVDPFLRASALLDLMAQRQAATAAFTGPGSLMPSAPDSTDGHGSSSSSSSSKAHPFAKAAQALAGFYGVAQAHDGNVAQLQAQARQALAQAQAEQEAEQARVEAMAGAQAHAQAYAEAEAQARRYGYNYGPSRHEPQQQQHEGNSSAGARFGGGAGAVMSPSGPMTRAIEAAAADLPAFLEALQLSSLLPLLRLLGCETSADVGDLRDEELEGAGVKAMHIRRLKAAVTRLGAPARPQSAAVADAGPGAADLHMREREHEHGAGATSASAYTSPQHRSPGAYSGADRRSGASTPVSAARGAGAGADHSAGASASSASASASAAVSLPQYDWEQFATPDGFLYYHCVSCHSSHVSVVSAPCMLFYTSFTSHLEWMFVGLAFLLHFLPCCFICFAASHW